MTPPVATLCIVLLTFDIKAEPCLTETKCNLRTFGVNESFWAKQQSCISQKVSLRKWCPFFVLFVLVDVILLKLDFKKRTSVLGNPANEKLFVYKKW